MISSVGGMNTKKVAVGGFVGRESFCGYRSRIRALATRGSFWFCLRNDARSQKGDSFKVVD
jgi:hypothetical protein